MEGRGRFNATSGRSASAIRENGMRGRGRRKKRKGRGKVIIGGPWRYACGVSLHFLINFYPEYILGGKREATVLPLPSRIFVRSRVGTQHVHLFPFAVFVYLFIYLFFSLPSCDSLEGLEARFLSVSGQFQGLPPFR